jgi:hypothetical protein
MKDLTPVSDDSDSEALRVKRGRQGRPHQFQSG